VKFEIKIRAKNMKNKPAFRFKTPLPVPSYLKYFFARFGMMVLAIINGGMRDLAYKSHAGDLPAKEPLGPFWVQADAV
jgi:hypothetical protein